jgi:hypothetical protein
MALTKVTSGLISADASSVDLNIDAGTLYIDSTNNRVGVGTSSPTAPLTVNTGSDGNNVYIDNNGTQLAIGSTSSVNYINTQNGNAALAIQTNGTERLRVDASGNVGIGTSSPYSNVTIIPSSNPTSVGTATQLSVGESSANSGYALKMGYFVDGGGYKSSIQSIAGSSGAVLVLNGDGGNVGIGTSSPTTTLHAYSSATSTPFVVESTTNTYLGIKNTSQTAYVGAVGTSMTFENNGSERMRIDSAGALLIGKTAQNIVTEGAELLGALVRITRNGNHVLELNRLNSDGALVLFYQDTVNEGSISVSGSTVSYNGGHLSRWSQLSDNTKDETIVKGTVMTNLNQMAEWTTDGVTEDNEQLNCMAVSSVEGDVNVAGVFVNWDNDDEIYTADMNVAMTGDMVIRIAQGVTVAQGDLLMSAGDGTAKPQDDDIIRAKTIAKVTSTHVSHTYDDGSYLVPCVLMAC